MLQDQSQQPTRRKFYAAFVNLLGAAAAAIIAVPAAAYLLFKPKSPGAGTMVEVANLADLEPGVPKEIVYHRTRVDGWKATKEKTTTWVVKNGPQSATCLQPGVPASGLHLPLGRRARHISLPVPRFRLRVGRQSSGRPGAAPLDQYESRVEGGKLLIGLQVKRS